jgi:hypothetical protein
MTLDGARTGVRVGPRAEVEDISCLGFVLAFFLRASALAASSFARAAAMAASSAASINDKLGLSAFVWNVIQGDEMHPHYLLRFHHKAA